MQLALAAIGLFAGLGLALAEEPAAVLGSVHFSFPGLESDEGQVLVALFDSEDAFDRESPVREARLPISDGKAQVSFSDLPPGEYALRAFHDENGNEEVDTNFIGIPKEAVGFSNDAMGRFGPPAFDEAKFRIEAQPRQMTVQLKKL